MAISNLHETLLLYTKQKSMINDQLSGVMLNLMYATTQTADSQANYNEQEQALYYEYYGTDNYELMIEDLKKEHEWELATIESWEADLEVQKNTLETKLNTISSYESSWTKLLQTNIKNDFSYGGVSQG